MYFPGTVPPAACSSGSASGTAAPQVPGPCCVVNVPGQRFWHTHTCPVCASSWTHIAPTPMTQAVNEKIHTCTKCGTLVYAFVPVDPAGGILETEVPVLWVGMALLAGAALQALLDRR
jgi:hypothetical protein